MTDNNLKKLENSLERIIGIYDDLIAFDYEYDMQYAADEALSDLENSLSKIDKALYPTLNNIVEDVVNRIYSLGKDNWYNTESFGRAQNANFNKLGDAIFEADEAARDLIKKEDSTKSTIQNYLGVKLDLTNPIKSIPEELSILKKHLEYIKNLIEEGISGKHIEDQDFSFEKDSEQAMKYLREFVFDIADINHNNAYNDVLSNYSTFNTMVIQSGMGWVDIAPKGDELDNKFNRQHIKDSEELLEFINKWIDQMDTFKSIRSRIKDADPTEDKFDKVDPNETWRQCQIAAREAGIKVSNANYDNNGETLYFQAGKSGKALWKFKVDYVYRDDTYNVSLVYVNIDYNDDTNFGQALISRTVEDVYSDGLAQVFESLWREKKDTSDWTELRGTDKADADEGI